MIILQRAQQIMFAKQHTQLDVEHIFLALLQQRNGLPLQIIARLKGDVQAMILRLDNALSNMQHFSNSSRNTATGYINLRANRVLQGSAEVADRIGSDFIGTEHILLAVARERGGPTGRILIEMGIEPGDVEAIVRELAAVEKEEGGSGVQSHLPSNRLKIVVTPPNLPRPVGFSHGIATKGGRTLYLAGQTALDAEGNLVAAGDVVGQYRQVLSNLWAVVDAAGGLMDDIVKMTIFVQNRDDYKAHLKELGAVHKEFFGSHYPATALLEVSRFYDDGVLVEIEGIAVIS